MEPLSRWRAGRVIAVVVVAVVVVECYCFLINIIVGPPQP